MKDPLAVLNAIHQVIISAGAMGYPGLSWVTLGIASLARFWF